MRQTSVTFRVIAIGLAAVAAFAAVPLSGAAQEVPSRQQALELLAHAAERHISAGLEFRLRQEAGLLPAGSAIAAPRLAGLLAPGNANVADPDPSGPSFATQSETMVISAGATVVEAYNDSLADAQSGDFTGYSVSTDGGTTWVDKNAPPNPSFQNSSGDPVLATDSAGNIYLSMITSSGVGVAKMPTGSISFNRWVDADAGTTGFADKPWLTAGRDPTGVRDNLYLTWTDFPFSGNPTLRAARSTDGGTTWQALSGFAIRNCNCQGTFPLVIPSTGKLLVFWENLNTPRSIQMKSSTDGGSTWSATTTVTSVTKSTNHTDCFGRDTFRLPDTVHAVRNDEFPSAAVLGSTVAVVWNDRRLGTSDIFVVQSSNAGLTWSPARRVNTTIAGEQFQPGITADARGFHVEWYSADATNTLVTLVARDVTNGIPGPEIPISAAFPVPRTNIGGGNQDGVVAGCYMGDYNQNFADGSATYYSWGDNRLSFANGDPDPNPFFAKR